MLEGIINKILQKYLGKYIQGLDSNNLKLGVFSLYLYSYFYIGGNIQL